MIGRRTLKLATAVLLGIGLIMALPVLGRQAARAASEAPALADRLFRVEWSAGTAGQGQSRIVDYVYNEYREDAVNVQLRISQLDPSGQTVASIDQPVGDTVPAGGRVFFDARVPGIGPSYRVAVASFDFMADGQWKTLTLASSTTSARIRRYASVCTSGPRRSTSACSRSAWRASSPSRSRSS